MLLMYEDGTVRTGGPKLTRTARTVEYTLERILLIYRRMNLGNSLTGVLSGNRMASGEVGTTFRGYFRDTLAAILGGGFAFVEEEFDLRSPKLLFFALLSLERKCLQCAPVYPGGRLPAFWDKRAKPETPSKAIIRGIETWSPKAAGRFELSAGYGMVFKSWVPYVEPLKELGHFPKDRSVTPLPFSFFDGARLLGVGDGFSTAKRKRARVVTRVTCKPNSVRQGLWSTQRFQNRLKLVERLGSTSMKEARKGTERSINPARLDCAPFSPIESRLPREDWFRALDSIITLVEQAAESYTQPVRVHGRKGPLRSDRGQTVPYQEELHQPWGWSDFKSCNPFSGVLSYWGLYGGRKIFCGKRVLQASVTIGGRGILEYFYGEHSRVGSAVAPLCEVLWDLGPKTRKFLSRCSFDVEVRGGGLQGQADACSLGIAKGLVDYFRRWDASLRLAVASWKVWYDQPGEKQAFKDGTSPAFRNWFIVSEFAKRSLSQYMHCRCLRGVFKDKGLLKGDSRVKERKKFGLKRARKASQYSKR
jgi:ribosomal protein S9